VDDTKAVHRSNGGRRQFNFPLEKKLKSAAAVFVNCDVSVNRRGEQMFDKTLLCPAGSLEIMAYGVRLVCVAPQVWSTTDGRLRGRLGWIRKHLRLVYKLDSVGSISR